MLRIGRHRVVSSFTERNSTSDDVLQVEVRSLIRLPGEIEKNWAQIRSPDGNGLSRLDFEIEPDYVRPTWPSEPGRQQIMTHLDIEVDDLAAAEAWAEQHGAALAEHQPQSDVRVMLDPAGHPFCLFTHG